MIVRRDVMFSNGDVLMNNEAAIRQFIRGSIQRDIQSVGRV